MVERAGFHSIRLSQKEPSKTFSLGATAIVALILICLFLPFIYTQFAPSEIKIFFGKLSSETFSVLFLSFIILSAILATITYKHSRCLKNIVKHIRHIKVQNNEIEIFQESESNYFDKYLDRILYMLSNSGKQYFIFEDIDRFDTTLIFERLKEINELANEQESHNGKPVIKFIYLLRDDIFINKERTKFFDFIIPVIPVTNTSNSSEQLNKILNFYGLGDKVSSDLIRGIGFYIEDLRLIKNISNEFKIYLNALAETNKLNYDKLLAMIAYKNLFPKDFIDLQKGHGFVHFLLSKEGKKKIIDKRTPQIESQLKKIDGNLNSLEAEFLKSAKEVAWAILGTNYAPNSWPRIYADKSKSIDELESEINKYPHIQTIYQKRKEMISSINNGKKLSWEKQKRQLLHEKSDIDSARFAELISSSPESTAEAFQTEEKNNNDIPICYDSIRENEYFNLLKYLLINGYIDESYANYTSYFYGEFLSENDQRFIMNIHNNGTPLWNLELSHYDIILKNISASEFGRPSILNHNFIHYILSDINSKVIHQQLLLKIFSNFDGNYFNLANRYINESDDFIEFGITLIKYLPHSFSLIHVENPINREKLVYEALMHFSKDELENINTINQQALSNYIETDQNFLKMIGPVNDLLVAKIIERFKLLKISFASIRTNGVSDNLLYTVFEQHLYELNNQNLLILLMDIAKNDKQLAIEKPLTCLTEMKKNQKLNKLSQYWTENMPQFINSAIRNIERTNKTSIKFTDNPVILKEFIENDSIKSDFKENYLSNVLPQSIPDFEDISPDMWKILIVYDLIYHSEDNLYKYIKEFGVDDDLINYINKYYGTIHNFHTSEDTDTHQFVVNSIAAQGDINPPVYESILRTANAKIEDINVLTKLQDVTKLLILINNQFLVMNKEIFTFIVKNHFDLVIPYIKSDYARFRKFMIEEDISIPGEIVDVMLNDQSINDEDKISFIEHSNGELSLLSHKDISNEAKCYLIANRLKTEEIPKLIENYDTFSKEVQNEIIKLYPESQEDFTSPSALKDWKLMYDICQCESIEDESKVTLISKLVYSISIKQLSQLLASLNNDDYRRILEKGASTVIKIPRNDANTTLLKALQDKGYLKSYANNAEGYKIDRDNKTIEST